MTKVIETFKSKVQGAYCSNINHVAGQMGFISSHYSYLKISHHISSTHLNSY